MATVLQSGFLWMAVVTFVVLTNLSQLDTSSILVGQESVIEKMPP